MAFGVFIRTSGPDHHAEFVATLPDSEKRIVSSRDDVKTLKQGSSVDDVYGNAFGLPAHRALSRLTMRATLADDSSVKDGAALSLPPATHIAMEPFRHVTSHYP
jgi:hypothetical protein